MDRVCTEHRDWYTTGAPTHVTQLMDGPTLLVKTASAESCRNSHLLRQRNPFILGYDLQILTECGWLHKVSETCTNLET
jgi:hypothetical protein